MHFIHFIRFLFIHRGKGIMIIPAIAFSVLFVFTADIILCSAFGFIHDRYSNRLLFGISLFLAGIVTPFITKNYTISPSGEREYYEEEAEYLYIKVTIWARILIVLCIVIIGATIADFYKLG